MQGVINKKIAARKYVNIGCREIGSDPIYIEHYCA